MFSSLVDSPTSRQFDRLPPHAIEAEMCTLGALLLAGDRHDVVAEIRAAVSEDDFFQADHAIVFKTVNDMLRRGKPVDGMTIREELIRQQLLEEVGGLAYLGEILHSVPSYANGPQYAARVRETAILRRLISIASDTLREAYSPMGDKTPQVMARKFADAAVNLASSGLSDPVVTLGEAALKVLERRDSPTVRRLSTGILSLDALIGGLAKSKFTLIGAQPRVGKSQLIKQIGRNVSGAGIPFGLVTVEEDREKVAENMLSNQTAVANHKIAYGKLEKTDWDKLEDGAVQLAGLPFYIDDAQEDLDDIVSAIERLATKYKCEVIAVDHLHLIGCEAQTREREVSKISGALKAVFKRCNVAGIAAAQLNRAQEEGKKPNLRSLRDSGTLGADADLIMLLHRDDAFRYQEEGYLPTRTLEVDVPKNKDGRMGEVPLAFDGETQGVSDMIVDPF